MTSRELLEKAVAQMSIMWLTCEMGGCEEGDLENPTKLINLINSHLGEQLELDLGE